MSIAAGLHDQRHLTGSEVPPARSEALLDSMRRRIAVLGLDLTGLTVVTEAATGAYAVTAVIAAMAGARVHAVARDTERHGSFEDAVAATVSLATKAGLAGRIEIAREPAPHVLAGCDILTNSGHLRPIARTMVERLRPSAVIALMFEAWEFRAADLDLVACHERGVRVVAVNERHPAVGVFPFLGPLCVRLLDDGGIIVRGLKVALLCDNPFASFIQAGLTRAGASVELFESIASMPERGDCDVVVIALDPSSRPALGDAEFARLATIARSTRLVQFWGDIDRAASLRQGFGPVWPPVEPRPGHMAILLSALGPEPIVRLQAGGLRAAELIARGEPEVPGGIAECI